MTSERETQTSQGQWLAANQALLNMETLRIRRLLRRRVLWLRQKWQKDPLKAYPGLVISDEQADWLIAGENSQDRMRFFVENSEASALTQSIADLEGELSEHVQKMVESGEPPPLEVLAHLFGLSPFERDVLMLCLAPELDSTFERLYAYVQDDVNRKYATLHLALTLFTDDGKGRMAEQGSFLPQAPLLKFFLVKLEAATHPATPLINSALHLDERIADYLRGFNRPEERIMEILQPMPPALLAPLHRELVDRLVGAFESDTDRGPWPVLNLTGGEGVGKQGVGRALCDDLGLQLISLEVERLPPPGPARREIFSLLEREAVLSQFALYLDATHLDPADKLIEASLSDVVERLGVFLILGSRERWERGKDLLNVQVPRSDAGEKHHMWLQALDNVAHSLDGQTEAIVQQFDFSPQSIAHTVSAAYSRAWLRTSGEEVEVSSEDLWSACRAQTGWRMDELAQRIVPCYTWEDIVLPEDVFRQLQEIASQVANRFQVYETWGFGAKLTRGRGISSLFSGPSGTGKTMAAEILAEHLKLDLYRIDLAGVVSKYIGETEKNLKKVFDAAEQSGAILFFDEADALFGKRTEVKDSHDRYANIEVNYLLQRMEDYRGLAILATNRKSILDWAFLRRLRFLVDFPLPHATIRRLIWKKVFPSRAQVDELDYEDLARLEIPGGNIRNIALNAAFLAASEGVPIGIAHVMHAARREYVKTDRLITEDEFGSFYELVKS